MNGYTTALSRKYWWRAIHLYKDCTFLQRRRYEPTDVVQDNFESFKRRGSHIIAMPQGVKVCNICILRARREAKPII